VQGGGWANKKASGYRMMDKMMGDQLVIGVVVEVQSVGVGYDNSE